MKIRFLYILLIMCSVTLGSAPSQRENRHENLKHLDHVLTAGNLPDAYEKYEEITDENKYCFINLLYWGHRIKDTKYVNASYFLGLMFVDGSYGAVNNASKAFSYFQEAALLNCLSAQINCARMLYYGKGIQKDKGKAYDWFLRAGDRGGDMESLFIAGKMLIMGEGVITDIDRGQNLIGEALRNGFQLPFKVRLKAWLHQYRKSILCACSILSIMIFQQYWGLYLSK